MSPIIKDVKLHRVLIDGGSSLNIMFLKTFDHMGLSTLVSHPSWAPFHGIVPRAGLTPVGQITLLMTFRTRENFCTEYMQFKVIDFEMAYNAFLGRLTLTRLMAIPHCTYLVLKMPDPNGVICIKGDVKRAYNYDQKSCKTTDMLLASAELKSLKKSLGRVPYGHAHQISLGK
jgi:hypothetical protein